MCCSIIRNKYDNLYLALSLLNKEFVHDGHCSDQAVDQDPDQVSQR
jgi:hypothetical protein